MTNIDPYNGQSVIIELRGISLKPAGGQIIASENIKDHNTFDEIDKVKIREFDGFKPEGASGKLAVLLPPKSLITLELG